MLERAGVDMPPDTVVATKRAALTTGLLLAASASPCASPLQVRLADECDATGITPRWVAGREGTGARGASGRACHLLIRWGPAPSAAPAAP